MRIVIGSDHRGTDILDHLHGPLSRAGHEVEKVAVSPGNSSDYPDIAYPVASAVANGTADRGILICGSGIGMSIAANKVDGVRAALVHDEVSADMSRRHNNANVLCLPGDMLGLRIIERVVMTWLTTPFDGGRHARRVNKIAAIEKGRDPNGMSEQDLVRVADGS